MQETEITARMKVERESRADINAALLSFDREILRLPSKTTTAAIPHEAAAAPEATTPDTLIKAIRQASESLKNILLTLNTQPPSTKEEFTSFMTLKRHFDQHCLELYNSLRVAFGAPAVANLQESPRRTDGLSHTLKHLGKGLPKRAFDLDILAEGYAAAITAVQDITKSLATDERAFTCTQEGDFIQDRQGNEYYVPGPCRADKEERSLRLLELEEDLKSFFTFNSALFHVFYAIQQTALKTAL